MSKKKHDQPQVLMRRDGEWIKIDDPVVEGEDGCWDIQGAGFTKFYENGGGDRDCSMAGPLELDLWFRFKGLPQCYIGLANYELCPGVYAATLPDAMEVMALWLPVVRDAAILEVISRFEVMPVDGARRNGRVKDPLDALVHMVLDA